MYYNIGTIFSGDAGHNAHPDIGAVGIKKEDDLTREIWTLVRDKLKLLKFNVSDCTPWNMRFSNVGESLFYRVNKANNSSSVLHLCVHFNAGGGRGCEAYVYDNNTGIIASRILNEIAKLGYINRGVKDGKSLYVVNNTTMPCILLECAFVDSIEDMNKYNKNTLSDAIVMGIAGSLPSLNDDNNNNNNNNSNNNDNDKDTNSKKIAYRAHVQNIDWQGWVSEDEMAGTTEKLRLEALSLKSFESTNKIGIQTKSQGGFWQNISTDGEISGTIGMGKAIEGINIVVLSGNLKIKYKLFTSENKWTNWIYGQYVCSSGEFIAGIVISTE